MQRVWAVRRIRLVSIALLAGSLVVGGPLVAEEPSETSQTKAWNVEEVKVLANQLAEELKAARQKIRQEPNLKSLTSGSSRRAYQFEDAVKALEKSARQYASRVNQGADHADTTAIARKIGTQLRDCEQLGRQLPLTKPTQDALAAAHKTLDQLAPYYGAQPLYPGSEPAEGRAS